MNKHIKEATKCFSHLVHIMHCANIIGSSFAEKAKIVFCEFAQNFTRDFNRFADHMRLVHNLNKSISNNQNFHNLFFVSHMQVLMWNQFLYK